MMIMTIIIVMIPILILKVLTWSFVAQEDDDNDDDYCDDTNIDTNVDIDIESVDLVLWRS